MVQFLIPFDDSIQKWCHFTLEFLSINLIAYNSKSFLRCKMWALSAYKLFLWILRIAYNYIFVALFVADNWHSFMLLSISVHQNNIFIQMFGCPYPNLDSGFSLRPVTILINSKMFLNFSFFLGQTCIHWVLKRLIYIFIVFMVLCLRIPFFRNPDNCCCFLFVINNL